MDRNLISVGTTISNITPLRLTPQKFSWGLQDVSNPDAGRVLDQNATMYKMRITQKRKIDLSWVLPTLEDTTSILRAFNPEYIWVRYFDPLDGDMSIRRFYVGDRTAPLKWFNLPNQGTRMASIDFSIIEV